ncbi:MAG: hypothetical protein M1840_002941 [Geoglossum simile]|nr:MAG: hypothetical protein M1840_002941 [Geoglossum simile]
MAFRDERTPLLAAKSPDFGAVNGNGNGNGGSDNGSQDGGCGIDVDEESIDTLLAAFGSPIGSPGLDIGILSAPLMQRGQVPHAAARIRWKTSQSSLLCSIDGTGRRSLSPAISHTSGLSKHSGLLDDDTGEEIVQGKFIGGVSDAQFWTVFSGVLLVIFVATFDSTLMASSHPVITSYFHTSNSASWLSTSFLLTSTAFQPIFGRISDTIGRRPPYVFSIAVFTIGTVWCGSAQSILGFIMARAVCGIGAGGATAIGLIINTDLVPMELRAKYQAYVNLSYGIGCSLGAATGGFLADSLGWRWEFWIQVPAMVLCLLVAVVTTPKDLGPQLAKRSGTGLWQAMKRFDLAGSFLLSTSVAFLILALNLGGNVLPWMDPRIIIAFVVSGATGGILVRVEGKADKPVLPLKFLFSNPKGNLIFSFFFASMAMNTLLFNIPLYFQAVLLDSATNSGARLILPFLLNMAAGFSVGLIITWTKRTKPTLVIGHTLILIGSILLVFMGKSLPSWIYTCLISPAFIGQGLSFPSTSMSLLMMSHQEDLAVAISTMILWRSLGTVMGVAVSSLIMQNTLLYFLTQFVTGPDREDVISKARKSVEAIAYLSKHHQKQVITAYSASLQLAFISAILTATIATLLALPIHIPRISNNGSHEADEQ